MVVFTLRKHAYSNILKISPPKSETSSDKNSNIFHHISDQNIDCGYSLQLPKFCFLYSYFLKYLVERQTV